MLRALAVVGSSVLVLSLAASPAEAKSTGRCPLGGSWTLTSLADLGVDPEEAVGIPSLDGNADGYTCITRLIDPAGGVIIFRDNTVGAA